MKETLKQLINEWSTLYDDPDYDTWVKEELAEEIADTLVDILDELNAASPSEHQNILSREFELEL